MKNNENYSHLMNYIEDCDYITFDLTFLNFFFYLLFNILRRFLRIFKKIYLGSDNFWDYLLFIIFILHLCFFYIFI